MNKLKNTEIILFVSLTQSFTCTGFVLLFALVLVFVFVLRYLFVFVFVFMFVFVFLLVFFCVCSCFNVLIIFSCVGVCVHFYDCACIGVCTFLCSYLSRCLCLLFSPSISLNHTQVQGQGSDKESG